MLVLISQKISCCFLLLQNIQIVGVLLQKDDEGYEKPIVYFSRALRDVELKYNIMEKKVYALIKYLKYFRVYVLHSHIIDFVPNNTVKDILTQSDLEGCKGKWIAILIEYDLESKHTKLIKG